MHELSAAEVSALRDEVLADQKHSIELANFAITASMAVVAYALSQENALVVLLPLAILAAARREVTNRRANVVRIATYMHVFAGCMFRYEARLWHWRQKQHKSPLSGWSGDFSGTFRLLTYGGYLCVVASSILVVKEFIKGSTAITWRSLDGLALALNALAIVAGTIGWQYVTRAEGRRLKSIVDHGVKEKELLERWRAIGDGEASG